MNIEELLKDQEIQNEDLKAAVEQFNAKEKKTNIKLAYVVLEYLQYAVEIKVKALRAIRQQERTILKSLEINNTALESFIAGRLKPEAAIAATLNTTTDAYNVERLMLQLKQKAVELNLD